MRRLLSIALLSVVLSVLLAVFALPGFATEAEVPAETTEESDDAEEAEMVDDHAEEAEMVDDHAEEAETSEETGLWLGLQGAFGAAVVFGALAFFLSGTEGLGEGGHH